jgi:hypothetical protein
MSDPYMILAQENRDLRLRLDTCQIAAVTREREIERLRTALAEALDEIERLRKDLSVRLQEPNPK